MRSAALRVSLVWVLVLALLVAVLVAACAEPRTARSPGFPHLKHLTGLACGKAGTPACLDCNSCHAATPGKGEPTPVEHRACSACHEPGSVASSELAAKAPSPRSSIAFDHDQHLGMPEIQGQCVGCHAGVVQSGKPALPPMSQCFGCHQHSQEWERGQCTPCHDAREVSRTLPQSFLRHDQGFVRHHGQMAAQDQRLCQSCHTQAECNACHDTTQELTLERRRPERVDTTFVHSGGFLVRHAIEARAEPARCARCHAPESCDSCHLESGVSGNRLTAENPHPPGWVGTNTSATDFHGRAARRDVLLCASCHEQGAATNCIRCHKVGAFGGNPHPNGWQSAQGTEATMCRYCHE